MAFGVTPQGFSAKRIEDIKTEMEDDLKSTFGDSVDVSPENPLGQLIGIFADRLGSIWSFMEQTYNSQYPATAEGSSLDNVASITGSVRDVPKFSKVTLTILGDVATIIPKDSIVSVNGNSAAKFVTDAPVTIAAGIDNIQRITMSTLPEAGSFTLSFNGDVTAAIQWNDTAATIQTLLEALASIGVGNVSVTGDVQSGQIDIALQNTLGSSPQPAITVAVNALTSAEQTQITTVADVGDSLDRTTIILYDAAGSVGVWIDNNDNGSSVPPDALAADRQIEITGVLTNDSANSVAAAVASALDADPEFAAAAVGNVITVTDAQQGSRIDGADVDTGFTLVVLKQGFSAGALPAVVSEVTAGALPQITVTATAQISGAVLAPANTLTVIETPITGWSSVTNALDAVPGAPVESDPDFRLKRLNELAIAGRATTEAIRSKVLQVAAVTAAFVFENDLPITDPDGRPAHSVDIVVQGGDEDLLATAIFDVVAAGIGTIGDISKIVTDSQGFQQTIKFSRPTNVPIFVELDIKINVETYPADGDDQVKAAMVAYGDAIGIGNDVVVHGTDSLECSISDIPGITDIVIRVGKAASPTLDDNIVIQPRERADFDTSQIVIAQV